MSGTTGDIIPIVIVPILVLAFWLVMIYRANSHPRWSSQAPARSGSASLPQGTVPAPGLSGPGPIVPGQRAGTAADAVVAEQARPGQTRKG